LSTFVGAAIVARGTPGGANDHPALIHEIVDEKPAT
jgi:hypothetical protein